MNERPVINCIVQPGAVLPVYHTKGAAGADVCAFLDRELIIPSGEYRLVPTGIRLEIPEGYEIQIRPRSGLAAKYGITCLNSPGTIDSDYRGQIMILMINHGKKPFKIKNGDRIAQIIIAPVFQADFYSVKTISETERGSGGFGSTGLL